MEAGGDPGRFLCLVLKHEEEKSREARRVKKEETDNQINNRQVLIDRKYRTPS